MTAFLGHLIFSFLPRLHPAFQNSEMMVCACQAHRKGFIYCLSLIFSHCSSFTLSNYNSLFQKLIFCICFSLLAVVSNQTGHYYVPVPDWTKTYYGAGTTIFHRMPYRQIVYAEEILIRGPTNEALQAKVKTPLDRAIFFTKRNNSIWKDLSANN